MSDNHEGSIRKPPLSRPHLPGPLGSPAVYFCPTPGRLRCRAGTPGRLPRAYQLTDCHAWALRPRIAGWPHGPRPGDADAYTASRREGSMTTVATTPPTAADQFAIDHMLRDYHEARRGEDQWRIPQLLLALVTPILALIATVFAYAGQKPTTRPSQAPYSDRQRGRVASRWRSGVSTAPPSGSPTASGTSIPPTVGYC